MRLIRRVVIAVPLLFGCGGGPSGGPATGSPAAGDGPAAGGSGGEGAADGGAQNEFQLQHSDTAEQAHGDHPSEIEANETHAAMRLFVVDPDAGPIPGVVIKMTGPDGATFYTAETDSQGYGEVLVPIAQRYEMEYLSLGRRNTTANVDVPAGPRQDIRLTLRYRRQRGAEAQRARFVLDGIEFDSGRATIRPDSNPRLDRIVEYMAHKPNVRIRIAGYTDNVGNPRGNKALSERRAQAVRAYLLSHGIAGGRVEAVGFGDQDPVASNDTEEGRQQNRRIEAVEL